VSNQVSSDEGLIASLDSQLRTTLDELANARLDVDGLRTDLKNKTDSLEHDQSEIRHLCRAVADAEEALVRAREDSDRDIKEMRRAAKHHDEQLHDCQSRLASQEVQVQRAFVDVADRRAQADDAHYRLTAYLSEIDRLNLVEAGLGKEIGDLRRSSASEEMRRVDLSKRIIELEKDKDLLNVALDSKQTELVLLQRSTRPTSLTATPWHQRSVPLVTSATSSRRSQTPTPQAVAPTAESTPAPSRRQSGSVSSSSVRAKDGHRNSLTCSTPSTPRMTVRQPLGASTKHNRTPEKRSQTPVISVASANAKQSELKRRSSLPVLVGRAEGVSEKTAMFGSLAEVEEAAETLG